MSYNELTVDNIGEGIKQFIHYQASLPDGPDLGSEVVVAGLVRDPDLKLVLDVKGEIVIRIKAVPEALVGIDDDPTTAEDPDNYTEGVRKMKQLAALAGATATVAPLETD